jgi:sortase A
MKLRIKTRSRARRLLEYSLLTIGVTCIGIWAGSNAVLAVWQDFQNWAFDRRVAGQTTAIMDYLAEKEARLFEPDSKPDATPSQGRQPHIANDGLVGRIVIPRLNLRAIVREGVGQDTLGLAAGHIPGTSLPGQPGNVGVAGHRDTLFRGLGSIRQNDLIQFETLDGRYLYEVASTQIVKPDNISVLKAQPYSELTLVTCYPFNYVGSAPDRFIVKARQVPLSTVPPPVDGRTVSTTQPIIHFNVSKNHSTQLAPGISLGITETDVASGSVNGWMWLMPIRRTIWLRNQGTQEPLVFYSFQDGKRRELRLTSISQNSVAGYLLLPRE